MSLKTDFLVYWPILEYESMVTFLKFRTLFSCVDREEAGGPDTLWKITCCYIISYKYWYGTHQEAIGPTRGPIVSRRRSIRASVDVLKKSIKKRCQGPPPHPMKFSVLK